MDVRDLKRDAINSMGRFTDRNGVGEAVKHLAKLREEIEYLAENRRISAEAEQKIKYDVARSAVTLLQWAIPELTKLADNALDFCGAEMVREVCAPIERVGTDREGNPLKPIPSGFIIPARFESVGQKAKHAASKAATVSAGLLATAVSLALRR